MAGTSLSLAKNQMRRALSRTIYKESGVIPISDSDWENVMGEFERRCAYCKKSDVKLTKEHLIEVSENPMGSYHISNIVPICQPCQHRKNRSDDPSVPWREHIKKRNPNSFQEAIDRIEAHQRKYQEGAPSPSVSARVTEMVLEIERKMDSVFELANFEFHQSLHPNTLFHFTSKERMWNILGSQFIPSYARERIVSGPSEKAFGVPMVSFCDLRLSELSAHMGKYGRYGIGVKKSWAQSRGLNPVFYVSKDSPLAKNLFEALDCMNEQLKQDNASYEIGEAYNGVMNYLRFMKNYEAPLEREDRPVIQDFRFADEREWRYVPQLPLLSEALPFLPLNKMDTKEKKAQENAKLKNFELEFTPDDIQYLIINDESEIKPLLNHLKDVKKQYSQEQQQRLATRIITAEQIRNDI